MWWAEVQWREGKAGVQQWLQWRPGAECLTGAEGVDSSKRPEPTTPARPSHPVTQIRLLLHRLRQTTPGSVRLIGRSMSHPREDAEKAPLLCSAVSAGVVL